MFPTTLKVTEGRALALVIASAALIAVVSARPFAGCWNDGSRLATVECLVDYRTFAIDDSLFVGVQAVDDTNTRNPYRGIALENGTLDKLYIDGKFYSDKTPVPALLLALVYQLLQWLSGLTARAQPEAFCWWMTVLSSGVAYVVAAACTFRLGRVVGLPLSLRLVLTASLALCTVALVYVQQVNNHIFLLGVASAVMLQAALLLGAAPWWRLLLLGNLAAFGYTIDLGAGPPLLLLTGLLVAWQCSIQLSALGLFIAGALPWLVLHHAVNYAIAGTFGPANAVPAYFNWEGCPFHGPTMTGSWHHGSIFAFAVYAADLLVGKRGFIGHNLPLCLLLPGLALLCSRQFRERPVLLLAGAWSVATWLLYAATSTNASGMCCSVRWFVPLLAPAYYGLAVSLAHWPRYRPDFLLLSSWGMLLMGIAWWYGPWVPHMLPAYWPIAVAALVSWGWLAWRRGQGVAAPTHSVFGPPHLLSHVKPAHRPDAEVKG